MTKEMSTKSYQKGAIELAFLEHVVDEAGIYTYQHADSKHDLTMLR